MLRQGVAPPRDRIVEWTRQLVEECKELLSMLLPLEPGERDFLDRLNDRGQIVPELLTDDPRLKEVIRAHPGLRWKALNVRQHFGPSHDDTT